MGKMLMGRETSAEPRVVGDVDDEIGTAAAILAGDLGENGFVADPKQEDS